MDPAAALGAGAAAGIAAALGTSMKDARGLSGGDINQAFALELADGRRVFAKTNPRPPAGMFAAEARGLGWLAEAEVLRVPRVLAVEHDFLVLELVEAAPRVRDFDERLGHGLAALHRAGAPGFGLDHGNFIGRLPQDNRATDGAGNADWAAFYWQRRLAPMVARAEKAGLISKGLRASFEALRARLPELVGPAEPPARLHGDLWGGNLMVDDVGAPCLIDPAVYGGHREIDLAMMRLFGGFSARAFAAYDEAYPLAAGADERVPLYQLYPLLVHVNLFGGSYVRGVEDAVGSLL